MKRHRDLRLAVARLGHGAAVPRRDAPPPPPWLSGDCTIPLRDRRRPVQGAFGFLQSHPRQLRSRLQLMQMCACRRIVDHRRLARVRLSMTPGYRTRRLQARRRLARRPRIGAQGVHIRFQRRLMFLQGQPILTAALDHPRGNRRPGSYSVNRDRPAVPIEQLRNSCNLGGVLCCGL